jgi:gliding motility-associated-like protein
MYKIIKASLLLFFVFLFWGNCFAQTYTLNGSATQDNCNCYTLTSSATQNQSGSVWNKSKINLSQPFDFWFNVFLGCKDGDGADGIAFILQRVNTSVGRNGSGMGFAGVTPSIGIALDTYQNIEASNPNNNLNDPAFDHISIQANGQVRHGTDLAGPVTIAANSNNVEDCKWHKLRITWYPATKWLRAYFDDALRVEAQTDLLQDVFTGDPEVYWGFSAATGGMTNLQQFCTALNPDFSTNLTNNGTCIGTPVTLRNQSFSFAPIASHYWNFGDGTTSTEIDPPQHTYTQPGEYKVQLAVKGLDGCTSDTMIKTITIAGEPIADFTITDTCAGKNPKITFTTKNIGVVNEWFLNGSSIARTEEPDLNQLTAGVYDLQLVTTSRWGCGTDAVTQTFTIKAVPTVAAMVTDGCSNTPIAFSAAQTGGETSIQNWNWSFGDGKGSIVQNPQHVYRLPGTYTTLLWANGSNGCASDTVKKVVKVVQATAFAGNDTLVFKDVPFQLSGTGNGAFSWMPANGLNNPSIANPVGVLTNDQVYTLTIVTPEGCTAVDQISVTVFNGSAIYVPTAFTPNNDGLNEVLRPGYKGIKKLSYFTVYNRWGQPVFSTTDMAKGWDGRFKNNDQAPGTYVWIAKAEDYAGKQYQVKGVFTLIR